MNFEPVSKLDKRNKKTSKKKVDDVMSAKRHCCSFHLYPIWSNRKAGFQRRSVLNLHFP